jgi:asparagine synthetase B (glutamine-hydrolysing)
MSAWAADHRTPELSLVHASDEALLGITGSDGEMTGVARAGDVCVAVVGSAQGHLGGPTDDRPPGRANAAARLLLSRYRERGLSFLDGLVGMIAVAVVDGPARRALLGRPPHAGIRIFVSRQGERLLFSTRLSDFGGLLGDGLTLDRSVEDFLLGYEFLPHGRTLFRDVTVLPAGTILDFRSGEVTERTLPEPRPWGDRFADTDFNDESRVIDALHAAFDLAVDDQMPPAREVGVLLGGVDSALIAAALSRRGRRVHAFSFRYPDESYNQRLTDTLAETFGLRHHWVPITPEVIRRGLDEYALHFNQVVGQPHYLIATAEACHAAREHGLTHCFTGDGCDGLFLGYPTVHFRAKLIQRLSPFAGLLGRSLGLATRPSWLERRLGHPYRILRNVGAVLRRSSPARGHIAACTLDARALQQLRDDAPHQEWETEELLRDLARGLEDTSLVRLAYKGKGRVGLNMTRLEGAATWSGLTLSSPYLHPGMVELAGRMPDAFSRADGDARSRATGKYLFLKMIGEKRMLPEKIVYQRKQSPVTAPVDEWYWGPLRGFMLERLEDLPFVVDRGYAESLVTPKLAERVFRDRVLSRYVTAAVSLLVTYASFNRLVLETGGSQDRTDLRPAAPAEDAGPSPCPGP